MVPDFSFLVSKDFKPYQDLLRRMAVALHIQVELMQENTCKLLDLLQMLALGRVALPINEAVLELEKTLWHMPASLAPTSKCTDKHCHVLMQALGSFFPHSSPNSLVVTEANERSCQGKFKSTSQEKEPKRLDSLRRKCIPPSLYRCT